MAGFDINSWPFQIYVNSEANVHPNHEQEHPIHIVTFIRGIKHLKMNAVT